MARLIISRTIAENSSLLTVAQQWLPLHPEALFEAGTCKNLQKQVDYSERRFGSQIAFFGAGQTGIHGRER